MTVDGCVTSHPSPEINVPFWWMYLQLFKLLTHLPSTFLQTPFSSSSNILLRNLGLIAELLQGDLTLLLACKWSKACLAVPAERVFLQDLTPQGQEAGARCFSCSPSLKSSQ